jgi:hypothetical protein
MFNSHTKGEILNKLYFAVDNVILVYTGFEKVESTNLGRLIYAKSFETMKDMSIRIVFELINNKLEICSIHFQKHK